MWGGFLSEKPPLLVLAATTTADSSWFFCCGQLRHFKFDSTTIKFQVLQDNSGNNNNNNNYNQQKWIFIASGIQLNVCVSVANVATKRLTLVNKVLALHVPLRARMRACVCVCVYWSKVLHCQLLKDMIADVAILIVAKSRCFNIFFFEFFSPPFFVIFFCFLEFCNCFIVRPEQSTQLCRHSNKY